MIRLRARVTRDTERPLRSQFIEINADANLDWVAGAGSPDLRDQAKPGGRDVESHAEQPQVVEGAIAGPTRLDRALQHLARLR